VDTSECGTTTVHPSQLRVKYKSWIYNPADGERETRCEGSHPNSTRRDAHSRHPHGLHARNRSCQPGGDAGCAHRPSGASPQAPAGARRGLDELSGPQSCASSAVISLTADLASPNSIAVLGSKYSSFSIPAKPGFIERLITITEWLSATSRIGIP
jgi:hypothetical protein